MKFDEINKFILELSSAKVSEPFGEGKLVYSLNEEMFAVIDKDKTPLRISLRCDPQLAKLLREKYDEIMPGDHLDASSWNTIIMSGQLDDNDIKDLIKHSYSFVDP